SRGSGLRSLAGMPPAREPFRRPLLRVTRAQTRQACMAMGLEVWNDPHNDDERFARVRVRRQTLPVLERTLGPGVAEALARTAELARDDADALDSLAADLCIRAMTDSGGLSVEVLARSLVAVRRRVLRRRAISAGAPAGEVSAGHVEALERLILDWHGQRGVSLPGHLVVRREAGELRFVSTR
ncbi:MAG: TilS substrate-binding domain-containing protein, partial [Propionibacteriales bacterium]|nr:TilS substrate-binding domain-containing protein [Propionibacteriales bacterium]